MAIKLKLYLREPADDKYYVGQSDNPDFRFSEHLSGRGAKWTRMHRPLYILLTRNISVESPAEAMVYENWLTLQYMERFGWENVRGGEFLVVESYRLKERIDFIYDTQRNKIKYYLPDCRYLFGSCGDWHVYVLELAHDRFISAVVRVWVKRLGNILAEKASPGHGLTRW